MCFRNKQNCPQTKGGKEKPVNIAVNPEMKRQREANTNGEVVADVT